MTDDEAAAAAKLAELEGRYPGVVTPPSQSPKSPVEWETEAIEQGLDREGKPVKPLPDNLMPFERPADLK